MQKKHEYQATGLEMYYNSIFPFQQIAFRTARAAQNKDVDFFSEKGVLDMSLVPIIGIWDDVRHDVSPREMVELMPDAMGLDPDDTATQLTTSILADPMMYMSRGITGEFKLALAAQKAARVPALTKVLAKQGIRGGNLGQKGAKMTNKEFLSHIDEAIEVQQRLVKGGKAKLGTRVFNPATKGHKARGLAALHAARKQTVLQIEKGVTKAPLLDDVAKRTELLFGLGLGIPFGSKKYNIFTKAMKTDKKFWTTYLAGGVTGGIGVGASKLKVAATAFAPIVSKIPRVAASFEAVHKVANNAVRPVVAFKDGVSTAAKSLHTRIGNLTPDELEVIMRQNSEDANAIYQGTGKALEVDKGIQRRTLVKTFDSLLGKLRGGDDAAKRAFVKTIAKSVPKSKDAMNEKYERVLRAFLDLKPDDVLPKLDADGLRSLIMTETGPFRARWRASNKKIESGMLTMQDTAVGARYKALQKDYENSAKAFEFGRKHTKTFREKFRVGGSIESLDAANTALITSKNMYQNHILEVGERLAGLIVEDASKLGMDATKFDQFANAIAQGTVRMEEVTALITHIGKATDKDIARLGTALESIVTRIESTLDFEKIVAGSGRDHDLWRGIIAEIGARLKVGDNPNLSKVASEYVGVAEIPAVPIIESLIEQGAVAQSLLRVPKSAPNFAGKYLAELSNDELYEVLGTVSSKFKSEPITDRMLGKFYRGTSAQVQRIERLRQELGINPISMFKLLEKVKKGGNPQKVSLYSDLFNVPGAGKSKVGRGERLSEAQKLELLRIAQKDIGPDLAATIDRSKLKEADLEFLDALNSTILARNNHFDKGPFVGKGRAAHGNPEARPVANILDKDLGEFGVALAKLSNLGEELKRISVLAKQGVKTTVGPAFIRQMQEALEFSSQTFDDVVYATLKESGATKYLDEVRNIQRQTLIKAVESGNYAVGMPFAYVGRIFSRSEAKQIAGILGRQSMKGYMEKILPSMSSQYARGYDGLLLEELNDIIHAIEAAPPAEGATMRAVTELREVFGKASAKAGFNPEANKKFVESLWHPTVARYAQAVRNQNDIHYTTAALDALNASRDGVAGTVIGHVRDGKSHLFGTRSATKTKQGKDQSAVIERSTTPISDQSTAVILRLPDGREEAVTMAMLVDAGHTSIILPEGDHIGSIFGLRATRGEIRAGETFASRIGDVNELKALKGKNIVAGDSAVIDGMMTAMANSHQQSGSMAMMYDSMSYYMKKSQTVLRPAFSVVNLASLPAQMAVVGLTGREALGAIKDGFRFFTLDPVSLGKYERSNLYDGKKLLGFIPRPTSLMNLDFIKDIRAVGLESIIQRGPKEFFEKYPGLDLSDWDFHLGDGQSISATQMFGDWGRGQMFTDFAREGLSGSRSVTWEMAKIWNTTLGKAGAPGLVGAVGTKIKGVKGIKGIPGRIGAGIVEKYAGATTKLAEATEAFVRVSIYCGGLRQGKTSMEAVEMAKTAAVDYAKLSNFERTVVKKIIPYYTFSRQFLPAAAEYYAQSGSRISSQVKLISQSNFREERGRVMLDIGDQKFDVTRMVPTWEALKVVESIGETFMDVFSLFGIGEAASRRERLAQPTQLPFTSGSAIGVVGAMVSNDPEVTAKQALADAFWINRFIFDGNDDPLKEETPYTKALKILWPARDRNIGAEKAMIKRRHKLLRTEINNRMIKANKEGDYELQERLRKELELLSGVAADQLRIQ